MSDGLPFSLIYNLNRLGQAGDKIVFSASPGECETLARFIDVLQVAEFGAHVLLQKIAPNRFTAAFTLEAAIVQACVVTLEPVPARITREFARGLHFTPNLRRVEKDVLVAPEDDDTPEEIDSLHYDLAVPLMEEFVLAIDPYPRASGVEFSPPEEAGDTPQSPFAVLKTLTPGGKAAK